MAMNNDISEYFLIARPGRQVTDKLLQELSFTSSICESRKIISSPVLSIASFFATAGMEETLIRWLQRISGDMKSFIVTLKEYGGLLSHSIYIDVAQRGAFSIIASHLSPIDEYVRSYNCPPVKFLRQPHMTIASNLTEQEYKQIMLVTTGKSFNEEFLLSEFSLLRHDADTASYKQVALLRLQPLNNHVTT